MGFKIDRGTTEEMHHAVCFLLGYDIAKVADAKLAVRTEKGIDEVFYLDVEDGRIVITGESFYRNGGKAKA